jgi:cellulose synthase/poly-beta-1,6-N-acetylglucosamine synthase-like glycosyltransferase
MISGYVPFYNAHASIGIAIASILSQTVSVNEIFVVDDGSIHQLKLDASIKLIRHGLNCGRGAARATAMANADGELVLGCDATLALHPKFLETAVPWFEDERTAAVFGWVKNVGQMTLAHRWRDRHLFRSDAIKAVAHHASLATGCSVVRKSAVEKVGGFDPRISEGEDRDLGERLLNAGFDIVFDPNLWAESDKSETVIQVLERYARWNAGPKFGFVKYLRQIVYSIKAMAVADIRAMDPLSVLVSLFSPHYQFWFSRKPLVSR